MDGEKIIRKEARVFCENSSLGNIYYETSQKLRDLKYRLSDFYSDESKAIFLDEIQKTIVNDLEEHRRKSHGGKASPDFHYEVFAEKMLFYLNQELGTLPKVVPQKYQQETKLIREKVFYQL